MRSQPESLLQTIFIPAYDANEDAAPMIRLWAALNGLGARVSHARGLFGDDVWVCTDCYFAHHYGAEKRGEEWFVDGGQEPCDREPLTLLEGSVIADNTDSETGDGINEFSWRDCHGCGSTLGGARYRLTVWEV